MLNASLDIVQKLTIDELEEDSRRTKQRLYGRKQYALLFLRDYCNFRILPAGFELDSEEEVEESDEEEPLLKELSDIDEDLDDDIEADETMKWEEEEEDNMEEDFEETTSPPDE